MASVPLPGAPAVFRGVSCRWLPLAGSTTYLAPVSWPTTVVDICCWVGGVLVHHLVFYLVPALLTLSGFRNLSGSSLLAYSCGGALLLGWRCLWCVAWFSTLCCALPPGPAVCAACPAAGSLGEFLPFLSPGACPCRRLGSNPSLLFSVLLLLQLACRGSLGSAPCVRVL